MGYSLQGRKELAMTEWLTFALLRIVERIKHGQVCVMLGLASAGGVTAPATSIVVVVTVFPSSPPSCPPPLALLPLSSAAPSSTAPPSHHHHTSIGVCLLFESCGVCPLPNLDILND